MVLGDTPNRAADAFRAITDRLLEEVPPVDMAGCTARMLETAEKALADLDLVSS